MSNKKGMPIKSAHTIYRSLMGFGHGTQDIYNGCQYFAQNFNLTNVIDNQNNSECKLF